jgi:arylformamidase
MRAKPNGPALAADFTAAVSLARTLDFNGPQPQHFGAPRASSTALHAGSFEGSVATGASCNCHSITLIPHCNGTHTESVGHLTTDARDTHEVVPPEPMPALLLTVTATRATQTDEDSTPTPQPEDQLITCAALLAGWHEWDEFRPRALLLRTNADINIDNPPFLTRQLAQELVARGVEHLVVDLPSVDRAADEGKLTTHRIFFGLPVSSVRARDALRPLSTITELALFPTSLRDGPCAVQLQVPAINGDAVPSRPLYLPLGFT